MNWVNTLFHWLFHSNENNGNQKAISARADLKEVVQFYLGWKQILLVDLSLSYDDVIVRYFYGGLQMIQTAAQTRNNVHEDDNTHDTKKKEDPKELDEFEPPVEKF